MIPYIPPPVWHFGPFTVTAFSVLAAVAILSARRSILRRAVRQGIYREEMDALCGVMLVAGFAGAYVAKAVLSDVAAFLADPTLALRTSGGIRSLGGLAGGFLGGIVYLCVRGRSPFAMLRRLDVIAYCLPFAWMLGRLGCALAHDHRGLWTDSWIAVRFPEGARYDLGLVEFLFLIGLAALFRWLDRSRRPAGFFFGLYGVTYGLFRVWLDTLHI